MKNSLLILVTIVVLCIRDVESAFAQGSLQLVFHPRSGKSSVGHPQTATLGHLWCQAAVNKLDGTTEAVPIAKAHFLHFSADLPDKSLPARIENNRAYLDFGLTNLTLIGKFRCELTTENDEFVYGNQFVYMRPVFHTNGSMRLDIPDAERNFELVGSSTKAIRGKTAVLKCPAKGFPVPDIYWQKDAGVPLEPNEKYQMVRNELYIRNAADGDEGIYRCIASNEFPPHVDYRKVRYEAILDQQLRITSELSWLIPAIVILLICILLVLTIYVCSVIKKRESRKYNVAIEENKLRKSEEQRLQEAEDDE